MTAAKKHNVFKNIVQYLFLLLYIVCAVLIFVESAMPGSKSAKQSNDFTGLFEDEINDNYDSQRIKEIKDFGVSFYKDKDESIILDLSNSTFYVGDTIYYNFTYIPQDTSFKGINIDCDSSFATIGADNSITFIKESSSLELTFTASKNSNLIKKFSIAVDPVLATSIEITNKPSSDETFYVGQSYILKTHIEPSNVTYTTVAFSSSDDTICSADSDGRVEFKKSGTAIIYAKINKFVDSTTFIVKDKIVQTVEVESISVNTKYKLYSMGDSISVSIGYSPANATFDSTKIHFPSVDGISFKPIKSNQIKITSENENKSYSFKDLKLSYLKKDGSKIETNSFDVDVIEKSKLNIDQIDTSKLKTSYTPLIHTNSHYSNIVTIDSFSISIPYKNINSKAYLLNNYKIEYDSTKLICLSQSYKSFTFKAKTYSDVSGEIKFYVDKDKVDTSNAIVFTYQYQNDLQAGSVSGISLGSYFSSNESDKNELLVNQTYDNVFSNISIEPVSFKYSGWTVSIIEGENLVELVESNNQYSITTNNQTGNVKFRFFSKLDKSISEDLIFSIVDKPNVMRVYDEGHNLLSNDSTISVDYHDYKALNVEFAFNRQFKDGTKNDEVLFDDGTYSISSNNDNVVCNDDKLIFFANKKGSTSFKITSLQNDLLSFDFTIDVNFIDIDSFDVVYNAGYYPGDNKGLDDFSKIALGSEFDIDVSMNNNASIKDVSFTSSDSSVISISQNGVGKAKKVGKSTITVTPISNPSLKKTKQIQVVDTVSPFTINSKVFKAETFNSIDDGKRYEAKLFYGKNYKIGITTKEKVSCKNLSFECMDSSGNKTNNIVSVDKFGNISLLDIGKTTLKVTLGSDDTLVKYSVSIDLTIDRDISVMFSSLAKKLRKLVGHYLLFAVFAFLSVVFIFLATNKIKTMLIGLGISSVLGFCVAGFSELTQFYTPNRSAQWRDVGIDFWGYMTTIAIFLICVGIWELIKYLARRRKNKVKKE